MNKIAVFVDWDNLRNTLINIQKSRGFNKFNFNDSSHLVWFFKSFLDDKETFYRIYLYTAKMLTIEEITTMTSSNDQPKLERFLNDGRRRYEHKLKVSNEFLKNIVTQDYIALRLGKLSFRGFSRNQPMTVQKEVDMLLGLDISHVSYLKLADKVMLFSKDTDIVPAMKVARINGLQVILPTLEEDTPPSEKLIKHCDILRKRSLVKIYSNMIKNN